MHENETFDFTSAEFKRNPWPRLASLRAKGSVVQMRLPLIGKTWLATRYDVVSEVLKDTDHFVMDSSKVGKRFSAGVRWWMPRTIKILADNMLLKDEPEHRRLRRLVDRAFHKQDVERLRGRVEEIADELISPHDNTMDIVRDFARPFPLYVIADILGLPESDRPKFRELADNFVTDFRPTSVFRTLSKIRKLSKYLEEQFERCRRQPGPGLLSALVEEQEDGTRLNDNELLSMAFLLLMAGHETTSHLISVGLLTLLQKRDQTDDLLNDWSGVACATEELLRYAMPVPFTKPRYIRVDFDFHGQRLKRGEIIMCCLGAANTDPAMFDEPNTLNLKRKPNPHVAFGAGIHFCLGLQLARLEAQVGFQKLLSKYPNMRTAVTYDELEWGGGGMRGLTRLPVVLN